MKKWKTLTLIQATAVVSSSLAVGFTFTAASSSSAALGNYCGGDGNNKNVRVGIFAQRQNVDASSSSTSCAFLSPIPIAHQRTRSNVNVHPSTAPATATIHSLQQTQSTSTFSNSKLCMSMSASSSTDTSIPASPISSNTQQPNYPLIILIGGSGFLGSEIRRQLNERCIDYIATATPSTVAAKSTDADETYAALDLTADDAEEQFYNLIQKSIGDTTTTATANKKKQRKVAVISAMGSIGTADDEKVNSALVHAIKGAHRVNTEHKTTSSDNNNNNNNENNDNGGDDGVLSVEKFVMIGNTETVRRVARNVPFLQGYASGKDSTEKALRECFGNQGCIIKPTVIYGGDEISLQPPRIPSNLGSLASEVLGLYPFQALADALPDALALPLAAPISVEMVAAASINVALGITEGYTEVEGEAIKMAGTARGWKEKMKLEAWMQEELDQADIEYGEGGSSKESCSIDSMDIDEDKRWKRIESLKEELVQGGSDNELDLMEELECLRPQSMQPAYDPKLNGRWNFVLSKDDLGTQLIKELLPPDYYSFETDDSDSKKDSNNDGPPWRLLLNPVYKLNGLYMKIYDEQSQVDIVLSSNILFGTVPIDIVFTTSLISTNYEEETEGTLFLEKFESIKVGGVSLPLPDSWQRFRYLEITYLDDDIVIARGSGGEPHVLVRDKNA